MRKLAAIALALAVSPALAQQKGVRLSIATGGTGGVYYPLGGGLAALLSKSLPGVEATAEVTSASVDNVKLVGAGKADIAFVLGDTAAEGFAGTGKFKEKAPSAPSPCSTPTRGSGSRWRAPAWRRCRT